MWNEKKKSSNHKREKLLPTKSGLLNTQMGKTFLFVNDFPLSIYLYYVFEVLKGIMQKNGVVFKWNRTNGWAFFLSKFQAKFMKLLENTFAPTFEKQKLRITFWKKLNENFNTCTRQRCSIVKEMMWDTKKEVRIFVFSTSLLLYLIFFEEKL